MTTTSTFPVIAIIVCLLILAVVLIGAGYLQERRGGLWGLIQLLAIDQAAMTEVERTLRAHLEDATALDCSRTREIVAGFRRTAAQRDEQFTALTGPAGTTRIFPAPQVRLYRLSITRRDNLLDRIQRLQHQIDTGGHR